MLIDILPVFGYFAGVYIADWLCDRCWWWYVNKMIEVSDVKNREDPSDQKNSSRARQLKMTS